jgi:hypothetical protein
MLMEQAAQNRTEAKAKFIEGLWAGADGEQLLSLAAEAALTVPVVNELETKIETAKKQIDHTNQLPRLRKDARAAQEHLDKVNSHATAEIARLEAQVQEAAFAAEDTGKAKNAAEQSAIQLLLLHDEGLVPTDRLPEELKFMLRRRQAEEAANRAGSIHTAASQVRNTCRALVARLEKQLMSLPISRTHDYQEANIQRALKTAKKELADAEDKLKAAETAWGAAQKAIPQAR